MANTHTDAHERRLLERARAGEEAAFEDLVRPLARPLKATALSRFRDRQVVDDAFQEAALSAWKNLEAFRGDSSFGTWFATVYANKCRKAAASRKPASTLPDDSRAPAAEPDFSRQRFADMLDGLDEKYRSVAYLHYGLGFTADEIAEVLGISKTAVTTRLDRARGKLRRSS